MFRGAQTGNVDAKGRLKPSATVQRALTETYESGDVFITSLDGVAVKIFPIKEWEAVEARLADKSPDGNKELNGAVKNKFLFQANRYGAENTLDNQGRFLVPAGHGRHEGRGKYPVAVKPHGRLERGEL